MNVTDHVNATLKRENEKRKHTCVSEYVRCVPELDSAFCELVDVYVLFNRFKLIFPVRKYQIHGRFSYTLRYKL